MSTLALSGHAELHCTCPLLGVKRTLHFALHMSACFRFLRHPIRPNAPNKLICGRKALGRNPEHQLLEQKPPSA